MVTFFSPENLSDVPCYGSYTIDSKKELSPSQPFLTFLTDFGEMSIAWAGQTRTHRWHPTHLAPLMDGFLDAGSNAMA
jgi:hypothetical protein